MIDNYSSLEHMADNYSSSALNNNVNSAMLTDGMALNAVHRACEFFNIPDVPVVNAERTCVWPNGTTTYEDDVFGFNREQLQELGQSQGLYGFGILRLVLAYRSNVDLSAQCSCHKLAQCCGRAFPVPLVCHTQ